ncbi:Os01g0365201 [Oryza sativa Japonica Group]|uniref:Os01g0365201 protein n=1 Tax=Oryza sativa subsp. japonica TaxID=39947 RepID=A0A0P0V2M2_ORYSJ|nr:Os01g0365201 [Oryza sativa Japonica Group]
MEVTDPWPHIPPPPSLISPHGASFSSFSTSTVHAAVIIILSIAALVGAVLLSIGLYLLCSRWMKPRMIAGEPPPLCSHEVVVQMAPIRVG